MKEQNKTDRRINSTKILIASTISVILIVFIGLVGVIGFFGVQAMKVLPTAFDRFVARFEPDPSEVEEGEVLGVSQDSEIVENQDNGENNARTTNNDSSQESTQRFIRRNPSPDPNQVYPERNNDSRVDENEASKPDDVNPEIERMVAQLEEILAKEALTEDEYNQVEGLFNELQSLHLEEYGE